MRGRSASLTLVALSVAFAHATHSTPARADEGALAESLFQSGVAAMEKREFARACPLLAESQRLDPAGGTLLNLALCFEGEGRVATAWATFHDALGVARRDNRKDRMAFAEEHLARLSPRLPRLAIAMRERTEGARVHIDQAEMSALATESPSPVDPGEHDIRVEAPGRVPFRTHVAVREGEQKRVDVPALALAPKGDSTAPGKRTTQKVVGWSLTGAGAAGVAATAVMGVLAIRAESVADSECPGAGVCASDRGLNASGRADSLATASTITGVTGAVLLAGGIILLLTAPPP